MVFNGLQELKFEAENVVKSFCRQLCSSVFLLRIAKAFLYTLSHGGGFGSLCTLVIIGWTV